MLVVVVGVVVVVAVVEVVVVIATSNFLIDKLKNKDCFIRLPDTVDKE